MRQATCGGGKSLRRIGAHGTHSSSGLLGQANHSRRLQLQQTGFRRTFSDSVQPSEKLLRRAVEKLEKGEINEGLFEKINQTASLYKAGPGVQLPGTMPERSELLCLAEAGDREGTLQLLRAGADVNQKDSAGTTGLLLAARNGHAEVVQTLLDNGADVDMPGAWEYTPLMYASIFGQVEIAQILLSHGASVRRTDVKGETALKHAVHENQPEIAALIRETARARQQLLDRADFAAMGSSAWAVLSAPEALGYCRWTRRSGWTKWQHPAKAKLDVAKYPYVSASAAIFSASLGVSFLDVEASVEMLRWTLLA